MGHQRLFRPVSAKKTLHFSFEQHLDLGDYIHDTDRALIDSSVVPTKLEREYRIPTSQVERLGIAALTLHEIRDPILDQPVAESAFISTTDSRTGRDIYLNYRGLEDAWTLGSHRDAPYRLTSSDVAELFMTGRANNKELLSDIADSTAFTGQDIVRSLAAYLRMCSIRPRREQSLLRFTWPTRSTLSSGESDATMQYMSTREGNKLTQEIAVTSAHATDPDDHDRPSLAMATTYTLTGGGRRRPHHKALGSGSVILNSHSIEEDRLSELAKIESTLTTEHYDRLQRASRNLQDALSASSGASGSAK